MSVETGKLPEVFKMQDNEIIGVLDIEDRLTKGNMLPFLPGFLVEGTVYDTRPNLAINKWNEVIFDEKSWVFPSIITRESINVDGANVTGFSFDWPMFFDYEKDALTHTYDDRTGNMLRSLWVPDVAVHEVRLFAGSVPFWAQETDAVSEVDVNELVGAIVQVSGWSMTSSLGLSVRGSNP